MKLVVRNLSALILTVFLVVSNAILIENFLDMYGIAGHRLFTGVLGTMLVILSFGYSMRKRKKVFVAGSMKGWLWSHEWLAVIGTVVIFIHTGNHFNALVPIITLLFMFTTFISGLTGKYVYNEAKGKLTGMKTGLKKEGLSENEIEERVAALTIASNALSRWRNVHMPFVSILSVMVLYHAVLALYYGGF